MERSAILTAMRSGGFILYARHGEATVGEDQPNVDFRFCDTQRNLSELGKLQASYYGYQLRVKQIPVGNPIIASPFCKAIETAQRAFKGAQIQTDPFWAEINYLGSLPLPSQQNILNILQAKLEIPPPPGFNQVIIAHGFPDGVGLGSLGYMETAVIRPLGHGKGFETVAKISLEDWPYLSL